MKILVVGSGGREDTLCWKLKKEKNQIVCASGNGGTARWGENINIRPTDIEKLSDFVKENGIELTVVGPEAPLVEGIVNRFEEKSFRIFGPSKEAAQLEASKVFAKEFMRKNGIPTAGFEIFNSEEKALKYILNKKFPIVIKADGLCGGKGVSICENLKAAQEAIYSLMTKKIFGRQGERIVIEDCLFGEEVSYLAFVDGEDFLPLVSSQDHKAIFDEDKGPNTGGMGAYSPVSLMTEELSERIKKDILKKTINGLLNLRIRFKGILYLGLMLTEDGPMVLEFNVRFGDPEAQAIIPRLTSNLLELMMEAIDGNLSKVRLEWDKRPVLSVVLASAGYPENPVSGKEIFGLEETECLNDILVFHSGTEKKDGRFWTKGGRVLSVTGYGNDIKEAKTRVYSAIFNVQFEGMQFRNDIGEKEIRRIKDGELSIL
ncbi:MAG: phosphoribosylamine--glycine ligase [bacterium]|nr:phosphoribosylamine--glycine ligase [bacterium]